MKNIRFYVPGSMLILLAFLIIAVPEILFALVAGFMVMIGLGLLYAGHMVRKSEFRTYRTDPLDMADLFFHRSIRRSPFVRVWYRDL